MILAQQYKITILFKLSSLKIPFVKLGHNMKKIFFGCIQGNEEDKLDPPYAPSSWNRRTVASSTNSRGRSLKLEKPVSRSNSLRRTLSLLKGKARQVQTPSLDGMEKRLHTAFLLEADSITDHLFKTSLENTSVKIGGWQQSLDKVALSNAGKLAKMAQDLYKTESSLPESKTPKVVSDIRKAKSKHSSNFYTEDELRAYAAEINGILKSSLKEDLTNNAEHFMKKEISRELEDFQEETKSMYPPTHKVPEKEPTTFIGSANHMAMQKKKKLLKKFSRGVAPAPVTSEVDKRRQNLARSKQKLDGILLKAECLDVRNKILLESPESRKKNPHYLAKQIEQGVGNGGIASDAARKTFQDMCLDKLSKGLCPPQHLKMALAHSLMSASDVLQENHKGMKSLPITQSATLESGEQGVNIKLRTHMKGDGISKGAQREDHIRIKFESLPHLVHQKGGELHLNSELMERVGAPTQGSL